MKQIILSIDGMTCSACSNGLEKYLNKQEGIFSATVNLVMANATIEYDESKINVKQLDKFVKEAGFKSLGEFKEIKFESKNKKEKKTFIISTILAVVLMYISMGSMIGLPEIPLINHHMQSTNYMIVLLVLTIYFLIYGFDILKNGYKNLIHQTPNMDTLVSIGVISSLLYSIYNMFLVLNGDHSQIMNLYFESSAIVIYFVKLGRFVDGLTKDKTKEAIQKLVEITPDKARIKRDGKEEEVTIDEIKKGDIVVSRSGEKIAVDGEIIDGKAHFDESFITGESKPALKEKGNKVLAGSLNYDGYIEYKAEKIGKESTVSEIVKLVVEASNTKPPIAKIADKISGYFVPIVIIIAIWSFVAYLLFGSGFNEAIITFVTILVVACPCSLGLATPLAIIVSEGMCATNGILIKKSEVLENARKATTIVFDKTGTLTYGKLKISKVMNYSGYSNNELLQLVGSIESKSTHPIANAFKDYIEEQKLEIVEVDDFNELSGLGIQAVYKGNKYLLGNSKILDMFKIENIYQNDEQILANDGNSIIYVIENQKVLALIGVNDIIKDNTRDVIASLNNQGIKTIMLTGDNEQTANKIAREIGITQVIANVLPTQKAQTIKELKEKDEFVLMCGDGINDSPALANADIGISVKSGTDIAMNSADVILMKNDLTSIVDLIEISRRTTKNIKQNLFWAFFYNSCMIPIAIGFLKPFGVMINPMIASLAMVLSSVTVILNALRLRTT